MFKFIQRLLLGSLGASLIHIGVAFMTRALLGSDPLTLIEEALVINFGLTLGTWNTIIGVVFALIAFICDKKKIGYTTIFYIASSHLIIDGMMSIITPASSILIGVLYMIASILAISLGSAFCVSARVGLSFYDAFIYSITDRFHINYVIFRYSVEAILVLCSVILHHYPSFGTVFFLLAIGPSISTILKIIKGPIRRYLGMQEDY